MQAVIDEQGRVEIPRELRERLHLTAGAVVNIEPVDDGLQITAANKAGAPNVEEGKLIWDDGLLVFSRPGQVITVADVNQAIEMTRQDRIAQIMGDGLED